jgi:hypothetical protein
MSSYNHDRRNVLRGLLAAGCALWLARSVGAESTTVKVSKTQAKYQSQPKDEQQCSTCMSFIPETSTCKLVEGQVSADGWCMLWAKQT